MNFALMQLLKRSIIPGIILLVLAGNGCKKENYNDALPVATISSLSKLGTDSISITGTITLNNGDGIVYEGFCYGSDLVPPITEHQILASSGSLTFTTHIYVKLDSTYYFRCFAANGYGYGLSAPLKYTAH